MNVEQFRQHPLSSLGHDATEMEMFIFTKHYATDQLVQALVRPLTDYFGFLWSLALQDAKDEPEDGPYKACVLFQDLLMELHEFNEKQIREITRRMIRVCKKTPIGTLLRVIMIANGAIMGNIQRKKSNAPQKIAIPSNETFIYDAIIAVGGLLFSNPDLVKNHALAKDATRDALLNTIYDSFPFEDVIGGLVQDDRFFVTTDETDDFAKEMIEQVTGMNTQQAENYTNQQLTRVAATVTQTIQEKEKEEEKEEEKKPETAPMSDDDLDSDLGFETEREESPRRSRKRRRDYSSEGDDAAGIRVRSPKRPRHSPTRTRFLPAV